MLSEDCEEFGDIDSNALRPHLQTFLDWAFANCQAVGIWTAAHRTWADDFVRACGPRPWAFVWSGERVSQVHNKSADSCYAARVKQKRLKKIWGNQALCALGFTRHTTLIIDDTPSVCENNFGNALYVKTCTRECSSAWKHDDWLLLLTLYLQPLNHDIANCGTVRCVEKRGWYSTLKKRVEDDSPLEVFDVDTPPLEYCGVSVPLPEDLDQKHAFSVAQLVSLNESKKLIELSLRRGYDSLDVLRNESPLRKSGRCIITSQRMAATLWERLQTHLPHKCKVYEGKKWTAVGLNEQFRFLRYHPGDYFKPHCDNGFMGGGNRSFLTVLLFLNAPSSGGETRFVHRRDESRDTVVRPTPGLALVFDHDLNHEGCLLRRGVKFVIRTEVMFAPPAFDVATDVLSSTVFPFVAFGPRTLSEGGHECSKDANRLWRRSSASPAAALSQVSRQWRGAYDSAPLIAPPRPLRRLKLMNDYSARLPLWGDTEEAQEVINTSLIDRLLEHADFFESYFHFDLYWNGDAARERAHRTESELLLTALHAALATDCRFTWEVSVDLWECGTIDEGRPRDDGDADRDGDTDDRRE